MEHSGIERNISSPEKKKKTFYGPKKVKSPYYTMFLGVFNIRGKGLDDIYSYYVPRYVDM